MKRIFNHLLILPAIIVGLAFGIAVKTGWTTISLAEFEQQTKTAEAKFNGVTPFKMKFSVSTFKTHTTATPYETQHGVLKRNGTSFYNTLPGLTSVQNSHYHFVVDSSSRTIMVKDPMNTKDYDFMTGSYQQFKTYVTKIESREESGIHQYTVYYSEKINIVKTELTIDATGIIGKSVTFYRKAVSEDPTDASAPKTSPRVEIRFYDYKTVKGADIEKDFSESNYFTVSGNKFSGAGAYKNYKVTDNRYKPR